MLLLVMLIPSLDIFLLKFENKSHSTFPLPCSSFPLCITMYFFVGAIGKRYPTYGLLFIKFMKITRLFVTISLPPNDGYFRIRAIGTNILCFLTSIYQI